MSSHVQSVTDATFNTDVLESSLPVLVDCWAEWCGPCRMIMPMVEEVAGEWSGRLNVRKLNVDENPETPASYSVRGIPTLMLFHEGRLVDTHVGALSKSQLVEWLNRHLAS